MKEALYFWAWFCDHQDQLKQLYGSGSPALPALMDKLTIALHQFSTGLFAEIGQTDAGYEMVISPRGIKQYFADALSLVKEAPVLNGWQFHALKPAQPGEVELRSAHFHLRGKDIFFEAYPCKDPDDICIRILHPEYQETDLNRKYSLISGFYYCLDNLIGERSVSLDINYISFGQLPAALHEGIMPLSTLPGYLRWRVTERSNYLVLFPAIQMTLLEGKKEGKAFTVTVNRAYRNYSFCTDFPWLLQQVIQLRQGTPHRRRHEELSLVYDLEVLWAKSLGGNGHHIATEHINGQHIMYYYISKPDINILDLTPAPELAQAYTATPELVFDPFWVRVLPFM